MKSLFSARIKKVVKYCWGGVSVCLLCILLAGCNAFLSDNDLDQKILDAIKYANAESYDIRVECDEFAGKIITSTNLTKKISDKFDIEFRINSGVEFLYWRAYSKGQDNKLTELSQEYLSFTEPVFYEGINKVTVTFLKESKNIIIKPVCILIPAVISHYPPYDNAGYPQDTSLKIYFNKPIKLSDFAEEDGSIKNIIIRYGEKNLLTQDPSDSIMSNAPFYKYPYLEDNGKTLVIPVNKGHYFLERNENPKDVTLTLLLENLTDNVEGENALFSEKKYDFTYRVNGSRDSTDPIISKLYLAKNQEDAIKGENLITFEEFNDYALKANYNDDSNVVFENIKNHHVKKVWVYYELEDTQSGVDSIEIQEQLIRSENGQNLLDTNVYNKQTHEATNYSVNNTQKNTFSGFFEYDFKGIDDGVIKLSFIIKDRAGNSITKVVDLIKDTRVLATPPKPVITSTGDEQFIIVDETNEIDLSFSPYGSSYNSGMVFVTDMDQNSYQEGFYNQNEDYVSYNCEIVNFEWWYAEETEKHIVDVINQPSTIKKYNQEGGPGFGFGKETKITITANPYKTIEYRFTYCDPVGNTGISTTKSIYIQGDIIGANVTSSSGWKFIFSNYLSSNHKIFIRYENDNGKKTDYIQLRREYQNSGTVLVENFSGLQTDYIQYALNVSIVTDPDHATQARGTKVELSTIGNGKYYVYLCQQVGKIGSSNKTLYITGKPFVIYKTDSGFSTNYTTPSLTSADIPDFEITFTNPGKNTNKLNCHVTWDADFTFNDEYCYYIRVGNSSTYYRYYSPPDFTIECAPEIKVAAVVCNKNAITRTGTVKIKTITSENDTKPPEGYLGTPILMQGYAKISSSLNDSISGLKKKNDKTMLKILTSNTPGLLNSIDWEHNPDVQEIEIVTEVTGQNDQGEDIISNFIYLPIYDYIPSYLYYTIEDNVGNVLNTYTNLYDYFNINSTADVVYDEANDKFLVSINAERRPGEATYNQRYADINLYNSYITDNSWIDLPLINLTRKNTYTLDPANNCTDLDKELELTDAQRSSYVKIYPFIAKHYGPTSNYDYGQIKYIYPPYIISPESYICDLKDYYEGSVGINILADQPCFAHTVYSPRSFGDDKEKWLNHGMEIGPMMRKGSFTYYYTNYDEVPNGYYYTTIIHFADGDKIMTDVKVK